MEVSGQLHAPAASFREKSPHYSLDRKVGGPQSRSGREGKEKNPICVPAGNRAPVIQPVA